MRRVLLFFVLAVLWPLTTSATSTIDPNLPAAGAPYTSAPIRDNFQAAINDINALQSVNAGSTAPTSPSLGTLWLETLKSATVDTLNIWDGAQWVPVAALDTTNHLWMPPVGGGVVTSLASSATTDLGSVPQASVTITGDSAISSFGSTAPVGTIKALLFSGAVQLTYNATSMILPGAASIMQAAGDTALALALGNGDWQVIYDSGFFRTISGMPFVATEAVLATTPISYGSAVTRLDSAAGVGAPPMVFTAETGTCAANNLTNDGGSCVNSPDGNSWVGQFSTAAGVDVREWPIASTDYGAAANDCLAVENSCFWPALTTAPKILTAIVVPGGEALIGAYMVAPNSNEPGGAAIDCANITSGACVTMLSSPSLESTTLANISITRTGGTPASGTIGLEVATGYNNTIQNVNVYNHDTCTDLLSSGTSGLGDYIYNYHDGLCQTHHVVFDGIPQVVMDGGQLGVNGSGDYTGASDFLYFENTSCSGSGCGPNTINVSNITALETSGYVSCAIRFGNFAETAGVRDEFRFIGDHFEWHTAGGDADICTDDTMPSLTGLFMENTYFVTGGASVKAFDLNSLTAISQWNIRDNFFSGCTGLTLAPEPASGAAFSDVVFAGNFGCTAASFTSNNSGLDRLDMRDNNWGALTVAGSWEHLADKDDFYALSLTDTATGHVTWSNAFHLISWTPVLETDGSSTGWTQTGNGLVWRTSDGGFTATYNITVTAKSGTTAGSATITGLPYSCATATSYEAGQALNFTSVAGVAALISPETAPTLSPINLYYNASTGLDAVQDTNMTGTTIIAGSVHCEQAQ